MIVKCLYWI